MKLVKYRNPMRKFDLRSDFDRFFDLSPPSFSRFGSIFDWGTQSEQPALDLYVDESNYYIQAEIPGYDRKEIEVQLERDRLVLKGSRKSTKAGVESEATFHRSVTLPENVKANAIGARYKNGILTVTVPKTEAEKARRIDIKN
ncbi:MAG: Hsp20 family protein [Opitutae bacterium]|nr:Hsp20 family protein [Opitutae bacterium]